MRARHGQAAVIQALPNALREAETLQQLRNLKTLLGDGPVRQAWQQLPIRDRQKTQKNRGWQSTQAPKPARVRVPSGTGAASSGG